MYSLEFLSNPIILLFLAIVVGSLVSKIKVFNISLDLSAILIVSVIIGYFISKIAPYLIDTQFENNMNLLSKLGTALFVSCIGLTAGKSISTGFNKRKICCFITGSLMIFSGIITMKLIQLCDSEINTSLILGILCGALTSTPGLSAVCESEGILSKFSVLGYGSSYLFGVIGVVLFVQIITRKVKDKTNNSNTPKIYSGFNVKDFILIGVSIISGNILATITSYISGFSIGTTGGILCCAIFTGFIQNKFDKNTCFENLANYQNFGLMMFFVGSGIPAGNGFASPLSFKYIIYGIILTIIPILSGYIISRCILKNKISHSACIIAGGMTSTPAIGVLTRNRNLSQDLSAYSFAYLGALFTIVIVL